MAYEHLQLEREAFVNERHRRRYVPPPAPSDPRAFGAALNSRFHAAIARLTEPEQADIGGFDTRKLLKLQLRDGQRLPDLGSAIPGVEVLSQENAQVVLAFATAEALATVESRLASLARDGRVSYGQVLFALEDFDHWTAEDRTGAALRSNGFPDGDPFILDVELWPQTDRADRRAELIQCFEQWLEEQGIGALDWIKHSSLVMARVRCTRVQADQLLHHRDVRTVDLPPRSGIDVQVFATDINAFPRTPSAPANAPAIGVLDTGVTTGHDLLGPAIGDAQGYLEPRRDANDGEPWHGTFVAGLALYGEVAAGIQQRRFVPTLRLLSGKVFDEGNNNDARFVENAVEEAVRDLHDQYGCKVFNLSYGDHNKVYDGGHVRGLAYTLDRLARELGILFVVPTGNLLESELPTQPIEAYPGYLLAENARLLDPAPALNVVTVGGLSRYNATRGAQQHPDSIEDRPIAGVNHPFPLTRSGPSVCGAIKPDFIEYAGNLATRRNGGGTVRRGLGVVSLNGGFAGGHAFREDIGTSYAAPAVAHRAAHILTAKPDASADMLRALLGAHARWPKECETLLNPHGNSSGRKDLLRVAGYGAIDDRALYGSLDDTVTLLAQDTLACDHHHFYEIPLPTSFRASGQRTREVTVAFAHSPEVRTTRLEYCATRFKFEFVLASSLDEVQHTYIRNRDSQEVRERGYGRWLASTDRNHGTLQVSRWTFKRPPDDGERFFVVVTRQDSTWASPAIHDAPEPYALAVVLADREHERAQLYTEVRAELQARARARARVRV